jgi:hypothetical protein
MASAVIHLAVAKVLEPYFDIKNRKDYYLGSIAPDIAKQIGRTKQESHFLYEEKDDVPNIKMFTNKYPNFYKNDFDLGYYIHLFTDKLWFDKFLNTLVQSNSIRLIDGTIVNVPPEELPQLIYSDYTNLNVKVIEEYNMDLSLFYEEFEKPKTSIDEVPIEQLNILIDKMGIIIENSTNEKNYIFDIYLIKEFIETTKERILKEIKDYEQNS